MTMEEVSCQPHPPEHGFPSSTLDLLILAQRGDFEALDGNTDEHEEVRACRAVTVETSADSLRLCWWGTVVEATVGATNF